MGMRLQAMIALCHWQQWCGIIKVKVEQFLKCVCVAMKIVTYTKFLEEKQSDLYVLQ